MKAILLIAIVIIALVLVGLAVDLRISSGPYDPESEARAEVIRQMAPQQTAQAIEVQTALAVIQLRDEQDRAAQAAVNRRSIAIIATIAGAACVAIVLGIGAGLLAERVIKIRKANRTPAGMSIAPYINIIRLDNGELRVLDVLTGANYPLLADRASDPLRADHLTRIEMANNLAKHSAPAGEIEIMPAAIQQPIEFVKSKGWKQ